LYFGRYWGEKIVFLKLMHKYNRVKQKSSFITFVGVSYSEPIMLATYPISNSPSNLSHNNN